MIDICGLIDELENSKPCNAHGNDRKTCKPCQVWLAEQREQSARINAERGQSAK